MEEDAGRGAPGGDPGLSAGARERAERAEAAGAVAAGRVVLGRGVGRDRSRTAVHILIHTWVHGECRVDGRTRGKEGCRRGILEESAKEGDGRGQAWKTQGLEESAADQCTARIAGRACAL